MRIKQRPIAELKPYKNNARTHSAAQIDQIAASITEFGFLNPVLIDDDLNVIAGHGRIQAAGQIGMDQVPTVRISHLSDAQRKAYIIADNKLAINAGWDRFALMDEIDILKGDEFDIELLGFTEIELDAIYFDDNFLAGTEDDQGKLDTLDPKYVICPTCGEEFDLREHG